MKIWQLGLGFILVSAVAGTTRAEELKQPPILSSKKGLLSLTLTSAPGQVQIDKYKVKNALLYNDLFTPPVLRIKPGDTIDLLLKNRLGTQPTDQNFTNFHYHGFQVSPLLGYDNVLVHVPAPTDYAMKVRLPSDHQSGLFWYHPHPHGISDSQVAGGMSGGMIVEGIEKYWPIVKGLKEQILLFKDPKLVDATQPNDNGSTMITLNGQLNPTISMQPGEVQFWRMGNIGADHFLDLQIQDQNGKPVTFYILSRDGNVLSDQIPLPVDHYLLPPGGRIEVLARAGQGGGKLVSLPVLSNFDNGTLYPLAVLATTRRLGSVKNVVAGLKNRASLRDPSIKAAGELIKEPIAKRRKFVFSSNDNGTWFINGQTFDMNRVDTVVRLGDTEEWTLINTTSEKHPFHIHQLDFFVSEISYNGVSQKQPPIGNQDVATIPEATFITGPDGKPKLVHPGSIKVIIPFTRKSIVGTFVYHCHILFHEDNGMMQIINVVDPAVISRKNATHLSPHTMKH